VDAPPSGGSSADRRDDRRAERDLVIKMNIGDGLLTVRPGRWAELEIA
jgi:hypothetical protein